VNAVGVRLVSELRRRWRGWTGLALLVGLLAGVVLTTAAGARRTESAYPRLLEEASAADFLISAAFNGLGSSFYDEVAALPQVAVAGTLAGINLLPVPDGPLAAEGSVVANAAVDGRLGVAVNRPKLLAGRLPDPGRATEALANREMARALDLEVGATLALLAPPAFGASPSQAEPVTFTVVGIGLFVQEVVPGSLLDAQPQLLLTPAYYEAHRNDELNYDGIMVRLRPDVDTDAFRQEVERLGQAYGPEIGEIFIGDETAFHAKTARAIRPQAVALALFAALAGGATLLVAGQALSRLLAWEAREYPALRALGMTKGQLVVLHLSRAGVVALLAGAMAVGVALAFSPLTPIGPASAAEPEPGFDVDLTVLSLGAVALVALLVAWTAVPAWRAASVPAGVSATTELGGQRRPSGLVRLAVGLGLPAPATTGIRMALEPGRGRTAVPVRSALVGTAVAIAAVATAATFADNLQRLVDTPSLYGQGWDLALDTGFGAVPVEAAEAVLAGDPAVAGYSGGRYGEVTVDGVAVPAAGIDLLQGDAYPTLLEGRPAQDAAEIVLGSTSLRRLGRTVGDTVSVEVAGESSPMQVVGRAVFPRLGRGSFPPTGLGEGAAVAAETLPLFDAPPDTLSYGFYLVDFADQAPQEARAAVGERFAATICGDAPEDCFLIVDEDLRPADISNYERVQSTPAVLAGLLVVLAAAALTHTLVTWVRQRRRDLAVLRAVGFERGQVAAAVAWQSTTLAGLALVVGLPLGVVAGRWLWLLFARQLGVAPDVVVPALLLLSAVPVTIVLAGLVAVVPGLSARRLSPAAALRAE
jgi:hypothetical protein